MHFPSSSIVIALITAAESFVKAEGADSAANVRSADPSGDRTEDRGA